MADFQNLDDTLLVREAQRGNHLAFEELVRRHDRAILRLGLRLTGSESDAQDIYQETFLKAYRNLGSFRFECCFSTWIYRIAANLCVDQLRRKKLWKEERGPSRDPQGEAGDPLDEIPDRRSANPERAAMSREFGGRIQRALRRLTPLERMVFELRHCHGVRLRDAAAILRTTQEGAKAALFRATRKLRGQLTDCYEG